MSKKQVQPQATIGIGSTVRLKSGGPELTIVGVDTYKSILTVVWSNEAGNIAKAELPVLAVNIVKA